MKKPIRAFKGFFYFRTGYVIYFAMIVGVVNIMTTTYFLAIDKIPFLLIIFPTFEIYVSTLILVGLPIIVITGWIHLKRVGTFAAEANITTEESPYQYKLAPGHLKEVFGPAYLAVLQINIKKAKGEKLTEEEINSILNLEKKLIHLIEGGYVGNPPKGAF